MKQLRALVVGYGRMGGFHAKVLRDLGYDVTTVDPDPDRAADYASIADAMLHVHPQAMNEYDVAAVATPAEHLVESAFQLAGTPMLVEKPFATNSRAAAMLAAYLEQRAAVCVGFVERFNPVVRDLRAWRNAAPVTGATFVRWNDRPSADPILDLRLHDIDLARALHVIWNDIVFDTRADAVVKRREIRIALNNGTVETVDLMDHDQSPLHAMWHAFLTDADYPKPEDAVRALEIAERMRADEIADGIDAMSKAALTPWPTVDA